MASIEKETAQMSFTEKSKRVAKKYMGVLFSYTIMPPIVAKVLISIKLSEPLVASGVFLWVIGAYTVRHVF